MSAWKRETVRHWGRCGQSHAGQRSHAREPTREKCTHGARKRQGHDAHMGFARRSRAWDSWSAPTGRINRGALLRELRGREEEPARGPCVSLRSRLTRVQPRRVCSLTPFTGSWEKVVRSIPCDKSEHGDHRGQGVLSKRKPRETGVCSIFGPAVM